MKRWIKWTERDMRALLAGYADTRPHDSADTFWNCVNLAYTARGGAVRTSSAVQKRCSRLRLPTKLTGNRKVVRGSKYSY